MSTLFKGILGPLNGKVGTVVGSYRNKKAIIRSLPIMPKRTTESQEEHRSIFRLAADFLKTISPLIKKTFSGLQFGESAFSKAVKQVIEDAISGTPPVIDYSKVDVANGSLLNVDIVNVVPAPGILTFTWTDNSDGEFTFPNDRAILVAYCAPLKRCAFKVTTILRSAGTAILNLPAPFAGQPIQTWISFKTANGKQTARSVFTGAVTGL